MTDRKLSIVEHLSELRYRLIMSVAFLIIFSVIIYIFSSALLKFFKEFSTRSVPFELIAVSPAEIFLSRLKISFFGGLLLSGPVIIFHLWRFVIPALTEREGKYLAVAVPLSIILFYTGVIICFGLFYPLAVKFLLELGKGTVIPRISVSGLVNFAGIFSLFFGIIFQFPLLAVLVSKLTGLKADTLRNNRRAAIVIIFILSALFSPPDPLTQVCLALPLILLLELSILLMRIAG